MLTHVDCFSLNYLVARLTLTLTRSKSLSTLAVASVIACSVASFHLITWVSLTCSSVALFDNVIRWTLQICLAIHISRMNLRSILCLELVWELTDVFKQLSALLIILGPLCHIVTWFLFLKAFEHDLIFTSNFHELSFTNITIETLFILKVSWNTYHWHHTTFCILHRLLLVHGTLRRVGMRDSVGVLQNISHLLQKDSIFSFNLSISL